MNDAIEWRQAMPGKLNDAPQWSEAMRPLNYEVMFEVEDDHWWFVGRRAIVFAQIDAALGKSSLNDQDHGGRGERVSSDSPSVPRGPRRFIGSEIKQILDIGCGTGATMDHLQRYGEVNGIDLSELPLQFSRRRGHERVLRASATELPFPDRSFDLITALDVIEHLDDDVQGLSEIHRVLKPGAPAVIFVPAFQALWGPNDVQSGHKRRYRIDQLRRAVEAAGLIIERISYANFAMFIPIWLGRRLLTWLGKEEAAENRINHRSINKFLAKIFAGEAGWLCKHPLPFGVSIICVVRR